MTAKPHYLNIKPLIIAEKYYPRERELNLFSLKWENLDRYISPDYKNNHMVPQPSKLADMIEYARKLSEPFKVVRVDFYKIDGHVYFGELTFTSTAGRMTYFTKKFLILMVQKVKI